MEIILLIVSDWSLRQLYHELLMSKNIEVVPVDSVENALVMLAVRKIDTIALYIDESNETAAEAFLRLRTKREHWRAINLFLLSSDCAKCEPWIKENDTVLNPLSCSPLELMNEVKKKLLK